MIRFVHTTVDDIPELQSWIHADPWHSYKDAAEWWICGGYLTFKLADAEGDVIFVRFDKEDTLARLHAQFAPIEVVTERRVAIAINYGITSFISHAIKNGVTGIVTESVSPKLVAFLTGRMGFKPSTGNENDYVLNFDLKSSEGQ